LFDLRIREARILDGAGNPWFRGDVGIKQGRITAVGDLGGIAAKRELHADDLYLAPGFIDIHTHSDFSLPLFRQASEMRGTES
jgi:N-acyl-D-amino-acid deacylase